MRVPPSLTVDNNSRRDASLQDNGPSPAPFENWRAHHECGPHPNPLPCRKWHGRGGLFLIVFGRPPGHGHSRGSCGRGPQSPLAPTRAAGTLKWGCSRKGVSCHAERSEASRFTRNVANEREILRCAQDDNAAFGDHTDRLRGAGCASVTACERHKFVCRAVERWQKAGRAGSGDNGWKGLILITT